MLSPCLSGFLKSAGCRRTSARHRFCRPSRRHQRSARRYLACEFYGLRSRILRSGDSRLGTARKSLRPKSVTHVAGTMCYPCLRAGPFVLWWSWVDLNHRPRPYQGCVNRFYNASQDREGRHRILWVGLWVENSRDQARNSHQPTTRGRPLSRCL